MTELDEAGLWQRWRRESDRETPDFTLLAAYADRRLTPSECAAIERALADDPDAAEDIAALGANAAEDGDEPALARLVARAEALVGIQSGNIVPFRRAGFRPVRKGAEWAALAASVALVAWLGFALGADAYSSLATGNSTVATDVRDVFDPPSSFFSSFIDQSTT